MLSAKHCNCRKRSVGCTRTADKLTEIVGCCSRCQKVFWDGCCVACLVLNGWLCGVSVLLCFFSSFNGYMFLFLCIWYSCKCAKMPAFQHCLANLAGFVLLFGFGRFRVRWGPFLFWLASCFFCFFLSMLFGFSFSKCWVKWGLRATSPDPKPAWFLCLSFLFCFCSCSGRFRVRWGGATSLDPKHSLSLYLFFSFFFCFVSFVCFCSCGLGCVCCFGFCLWTKTLFCQ